MKTGFLGKPTPKLQVFIIVLFRDTYAVLRNKLNTISEITTIPWGFQKKCNSGRTRSEDSERVKYATRDVSEKHEFPPRSFQRCNLRTKNPPKFQLAPPFVLGMFAKHTFLLKKKTYPKTAPELR